MKKIFTLFFVLISFCLLFTGCSNYLNTKVAEIKLELDGFYNPKPKVENGEPFKKQIIVSWSSIFGASSYEVWYSTGVNFKNAKKVKTIESDERDKTITYTHQNNSFEDGSIYYYWIVANTSSGYSGMNVSPVSVVFNTNGQVKNVSAKAGDINTEVHLYWDKVDNASCYYVYRSTTDDISTAIKVKEVKKEFAEIDRNKIDYTYYFWIQATVNGSLTGFSSPVSYTPKPMKNLGFITKLKVSPGTSSSSCNKLSWSNDACSYVNIYRNIEDNFDNAVRIEEATSSRYSYYYDYSIDEGVNYAYWVIPSDRDGNEALLIDGDCTSIFGNIAQVPSTATDITKYINQGYLICSANAIGPGVTSHYFACTKGTKYKINWADSSNQEGKQMLLDKGKNPEDIKVSVFLAGDTTNVKECGKLNQTKGYSNPIEITAPVNGYITIKYNFAYGSGYHWMVRVSESN